MFDTYVKEMKPNCSFKIMGMFSNAIIFLIYAKKHNDWKSQRELMKSKWILSKIKYKSSKILELVKMKNLNKWCTFDLKNELNKLLL